MNTSRSTLWMVLLLAVPASIYAQETPPVEEGAPEEATTPSRNLLGKYLEVVVTNREGVTFTGWIRDRARIEIYNPSTSNYQVLKDTMENRLLDGAGLRLYYPDGMQGVLFLKYADLAPDQDAIQTVRDISAEEEMAWEAELDRQLEEQRAALRRRAEMLQQLAEEEAAAEEGTEGVLPAESDIPAELVRGYELLAEFPPPEWGEDSYKKLRKVQLTARRSLTDDEQRFVDSYLDEWKPAYTHWLAEGGGTPPAPATENAEKKPATPADKPK